MANKDDKKIIQMQAERTLVIIKPDAMQRGLIGEIISRIERVGLKLVGSKMFIADSELAHKHYPVDRTEFIDGMGEKTLSSYVEQGIDPMEVFGTADPHKIGLELQQWLIEFITSAPVLMMVWQGPHAIDVVRKIAGFTLPQKADPGTIRGDYSFDSSALGNASARPIRNLVHASGSPEEAAFEIELWFKKSELYTYDAVHQQYMLH